MFTDRRETLHWKLCVYPLFDHMVTLCSALVAASHTVRRRFEASCLRVRIVSKAKARHQPAPHPGIQLVNHKGSSSTLTNRLLGTTAWLNNHTSKGRTSSNPVYVGPAEPDSTTDEDGNSIPSSLVPKATMSATSLRSATEARIEKTTTDRYVRDVI